MNKLLVICGSTATGKTSLAIHLCQLFNGEVVSADSKQVYKGMNIGTGKDLPVNPKLKIENLKLPGFYEVDGVEIWGYDLADPKQKFSVAHYIKIAQKIAHYSVPMGGTMMNIIVKLIWQTLKEIMDIVGQNIYFYSHVKKTCSHQSPVRSIVMNSIR